MYNVHSFGLSWHWAMWASAGPRNKDIIVRGAGSLEHLPFREHPQQRQLLWIGPIDIPGHYLLKSVWLPAESSTFVGLLGLSPVVNDDDNQSWLCSCHPSTWYVQSPLCPRTVRGHNATDICQSKSEVTHVLGYGCGDTCLSRTGNNIFLWPHNTNYCWYQWFKNNWKLINKWFQNLFNINLY